MTNNNKDNGDNDDDDQGVDYYLAAAAAAAANVKTVDPSAADGGGYEWGKKGDYGGDPVWAKIRETAKVDADAEPLLSSYMYMSVLSHDTLEQAISFVLANRLADSTLLPTQLMEMFNSVLFADDGEGRFVRSALRHDIRATYERDPACNSYVHAVLYLKGFHALQAHRIQHALWNRGQRLLALTMQARISTVFAMDLHPAARMGKGILIDHGTGVVIGETAVVGDNVSILQGVTLGGTGKDVGDRHPKIGKGVLVGAHSTILGNITVGKGAMIAAGSLVLKPVEKHVMVAGAPAKKVGMALSSAPALEMAQELRTVPTPPTFCDDLEEAMRKQAEKKQEDEAGRLSIFEAEECLDVSLTVDLEECVEARKIGSGGGGSVKKKSSAAGGSNTTVKEGKIAEEEDDEEDALWYSI